LSGVVLYCIPLLAWLPGTFQKSSPVPVRLMNGLRADLASGDGMMSRVGVSMIAAP